VLGIRNLGPSASVPSPSVLNGPGAWDFSTQGGWDAADCRVGAAIAPGAECHLTVYFQADGTGPRVAQLNVDAPQLASLALAAITGTGVSSVAVPALDVIEFAHPADGQYFLAADPAEIALLDAGGPGGGWQRTGMRFTAWPADSAQPGDAQPVCRFFGTPGVGPNSHFFTADAAECAAVRRDAHWIDEGIAFRARLPASAGCAAGDTPLWRLWCAVADATASRHRNVTDQALVSPMVAGGWVLEGAVMCVAGGGG
jgi:hypothetical protein